MVCVKCAGMGDCIETSWGIMCRPCFHAGLKETTPAGKPRLFSFPPAGLKIFAVMEPPTTYLTLDGTLYLFERRKDAAALAQQLHAGYGVEGARAVEVDARAALEYVLARPALRLITVKEKVNAGGRPLKSDEIEAPRL